MPSACTSVVIICGLPASSVTVIVTTVPSGSPVAVPEMVGVVSLVSPTGSIITVGAAVSTSPVVVAVVSLPAVSVTDTSTVNSPSLNSFGTSTLNVPSACTSVVMVCGLPASSVTIIVTTVPSGSPVAVPEIVGVVSLLSASASIVIFGAVLSIVPCAEASLWLPASSLTMALTLKSPSTNSLVVSAVQLPSASVCVVIVCVLPPASVTINVTVVPAGTFCTEPEIVGVVSALSGIVLIAIIGADKSIVPLTVSLASLPAASVTVAVIVKSPSATA